MPTNMPNGIDNFTNPTSTSQQNDATVLHHTQHDNLNDAVHQIEQAVVGPALNIKGLGAGQGGDDTAIFAQAWFNLGSGGGIVYMPAGTYNVNSFPNFNLNNISLVGAGSEVVTVNHTGTANLINVVVNSSGQPVNIKLKGFSINSTNTSATANAIYWADTIGGVIEDIQIQNYTQPTNKAIWLQNQNAYIDGLSIRDVTVNNVTLGIVFDATSAGTSWRNIQIEDFYYKLPSTSSTQVAVKLQGGGTLVDSSIQAKGVISGSLTNLALNTVFALSNGSSIADTHLGLSGAIQASNYAPNGFVGDSTTTIVNCGGVMSFNLSNGARFSNSYANTASNIQFYGVWDVAGIVAMTTHPLLVGTAFSSPIKNPVTGDSYFQADYGRVAYWSGTQWITSNLYSGILGGTTSLIGNMNVSAGMNITGNYNINVGTGTINADHMTCQTSFAMAVNTTMATSNLTAYTIVTDFITSNYQTIAPSYLANAGTFVSNIGYISFNASGNASGNEVMRITLGVPGATDYQLNKGLSSAITGAAVCIAGISGQLGIGGSRLAYKKNIVELDKVNWSQDKNPIYQMKPVHFEWRAEEVGTRIRDNDGKVIDRVLEGRSEEVGFIVEDIHEISPKLTVDHIDGEPVQYKTNSLVALLVEAVQCQRKEIDQLKQDLQNLKNAQA